MRKPWKRRVSFQDSLLQLLVGGALQSGVGVSSVPWLQGVQAKHRQPLRGYVDPVVPVGAEQAVSKSTREIN